MHEKVGGQTTLIDPALEKVRGQLTYLTPCFRGLCSSCSWQLVVISVICRRSTKSLQYRVPADVVGPEGVESPVLVSRTPWSVLAVWGEVGRVNSNSTLTFQLQFRPTSQSTVLRFAAWNFQLFSRYWHDDAVGLSRLSIRLLHCALWLKDTSYSKSVWTSE